MRCFKFIRESYSAEDLTNIEKQTDNKQMIVGQTDEFEEGKDGVVHRVATKRDSEFNGVPCKRRKLD